MGKKTREDEDPSATVPKSTKKSKKSKEVSADEPGHKDPEEPTGKPEVVEVEKKKSKKKKEKETVEADEAKIDEAVDEPSQPEKKKKKSKKAVSEEQPEEQSSGKKKRKREAAGEEKGAETAVNPSDEPKKKKSKNKTAFPDPSADGQLSDQGRKALSYAFTQFRDPPRWKFQKARQNWLCRNIWSPQAVPDVYLPLATKYLSNVQGYARENLSKKCTSIIEGTHLPESSDSKPDGDESAAEPGPPEIRLSRAKAILDAFATTSSTSL